MMSVRIPSDMQEDSCLNLDVLTHLTLVEWPGRKKGSCVFWGNRIAMKPPFAGLVAQSVEQRPEKACVGGSIPSQATTLLLKSLI